MSFFDNFKSKTNRFFGSEGIYDPLNKCCYNAETWESTGDGVTTDFTLSGAPYDENGSPITIMVFVGGTLIKPSDYTLDGNSLSFTVPPASGQDIVVYSFYG